MITHMDLGRPGTLLSGEYSADKGVDRFEFMFKFVMKHFFNSQMSPEIITDENILCDKDDI